MGTSLTGLTPATTYDALIKVGDNGPLSSTAKVLSDGLGNDSILALSTSQIGIGTNSPAATLNVNEPSGADFLLSRTAGATSGILGTIRFGNLNVDSNMSAISAEQDGATNAANLIFSTQATGGATTERLRITSAGNVGIGTSSPGVKLDVSQTMRLINVGEAVFYLNNGVLQHQIAIAADPSNKLSFRYNATEGMALTQYGLTFNGDTAAANALDDYEEGTWTPTYTQDGTPNTATYATRSGTYTKIGNLVTVFFDIDASSLTAGSGNCRVDGLPFTVSNSMAGFSFVSFRDPSVFVGTATDVTFIGFAQKGSNYIMCRNISTTTGSESAQTSFAGSGRVTGMVQYTA